MGEDEKDTKGKFDSETMTPGEKAKTVFTDSFYEFFTTIFAMVALLLITITGHSDNTEIVSIFSMILGGGFWGGVQKTLRNERARKAGDTKY